MKDDAESRTSSGGSRTAATFKMELFVIIFNGWKHYHKLLHLVCCSSSRSDSNLL